MNNKRNIEKVDRPALASAYVQYQVEFIHRNTGRPKDEIEKFVAKQIRINFKDIKTSHVYSKSSGNEEIKTQNLSTVLNSFRNKIITPSGSIYKPSSDKVSFISNWTEQGIASRGIIKKRMFAAEEAGDKAAYNKEKYAQTSVKIRLNSHPGALGSPYNVFYDKGSYNAITSSARALIAHSYTTCEQVLGGNFAIFDEEEAINHILNCVRIIPSISKINKLIMQYDIIAPSYENLYFFFKEILQQYRIEKDFKQLRKLISSLNKQERTFIFYYNNLKNLLQTNEHTFKPIVENLLKNEFEFPNVGEPEFKAIDDDLKAVVFTILTDEMQSIAKGNKLSDYPTIVNKCASLGITIQNKLNKLDELFNTFIYVDGLTQKILSRSKAYRNTVIISDTDSVIYTSKNWVEWYVGQIDCLNQNSYNISALMTYWLTKANDNTMEKFSIAHGATGKHIKTMRMKNEFLYPTLILYNIKKVYAGIIKVQEGIVLAEPRPDLKGGAIRSSNVSKEGREFTSNLIIEDILKPCQHGKISAIELIKKVVLFELKLKNALIDGETTYLSRESVKMESDYKDPAKESRVFNVKVYNHVFGKKYGEIIPPDKVPELKIIKPNQLYLNNLAETDPEMAKRFTKIMADFKRIPTRIPLANANKKIPKELIPLIDIKEILYPTMKPVYLTLSRLGINVGHEKHKLLLSDTYII